MSALSIRHMNFTLSVLERVRWEEDARIAATLPHVDWYDWMIDRPARRGKKRVIVTVLQGYTKAEFARWWIKYAQPGWKAKVWFNPQKIERQLSKGVLS